jgi:hypothetical protein
VSTPALRARLGFVAAVLLVAALHLALLKYNGGELLLSTTPVDGLDYETHLSQTWRVIEGLDGWGKSWVYDPRHLAGFPTGTIFDADNKGWTFFTYGLHLMGVPQGLGFNLFVLAAHLLGPPVVYLSARWFGVRPWAALLAAAFSVLLWWFDSWMHWCWYVGMTAYDFATYLWLLPMALFHRWCEERRAWQAVGVALLMATLHMVHPYTFFMLALPLAALYLRAWSTLGVRGHATVWGIALFTVAVNAWWLLIAIEFSPYVLDSSLFGHTMLRTLPFDMLGLLADPGVTGVLATRATYRFIAIGAGAVMVWHWRKRGDPRALPIGTAMLSLFAFAYFGGVTPLSNIQPYRHVGPLMYVALIPAAALVEDAVTHHRLRVWPQAARRALVLASIPALLLMARDTLYFTERSLPKPAPLPNGERTAFGALGSLSPAEYQHASWSRDDLAQWIRDNDDGQGRILVEGWAWGEQLAWKTDGQILGGFVWRNLEHSWSNLFRRRPQGILPPPEFQQYVEDWGVRWVITASPRQLTPWWDVNPHLALYAELPPFRVFRVKPSTSLFMQNHGTVHASTNRIEVEGSNPDEDVVLRYHWLETFGCEPDCRAVRQRVRQTKVGFIRVPAPHPADFAVVNTYRRGG